jgi:uncharacterized membrane protein
MTKRILVLLLPLWLFASQGKAEYFTITNFRILVNFTEEGYADFEEVIEVQFAEPRHGIFRAIPIRSVIKGKNVDRIIREIAVDGYKFSTSKENNNLIIKIGDADKLVEGRQIYRIHYRVLDPLNFFEDHTEFYWDILGVSWPVEIENCSFRVTFPEKVSLNRNDVIGHTGEAGSLAQNLDFQVSPRVIDGKGTQKFLAGEGLTLAVNLPADTFHKMSAFTEFRERHGLLFVPLIFLFAGLLGKFIARNRPQTIMTEFFPPDGVSPVIAGGFVDNSVDNSDVLSLIPHLANLGYLRMEVTGEKTLFKKEEITFIKLKEAGPELLPFDTQFFNALFATGERVRLSDLKDRFYTHMAGVKASVREWIGNQGWYEPDQKAMGCVTAISGLISLAWGGYAAFAQQNTDGFVLIGVGLLLFFLASRFHKRSQAGNKTFQKLEGFRQFVKKAEKPVIERLMKDDPLYYDKTMPYALAFGYLKQWNKHFEGLLSQPPSWYSSPYMYGTNLSQSWSSFSESFPSEINSIDSVFTSSPSSSGSGGGGGGFSGGGSGGGGGGSW